MNREDEIAERFKRSPVHRGVRDQEDIEWLRKVALAARAFQLSSPSSHEVALMGYQGPALKRFDRADAELRTLLENNPNK